MGYMRHHVIIVTTFLKPVATQAHAKACDIFNAPVDDLSDTTNADRAIVTPIITGAINSYYTFLVGPDGSKEGWPTSDEFDDRRNTFVQWLNATFRYEDGSTSAHYAEVFYGDDDCNAGIVRHDGEKGNAHHP